MSIKIITLTLMAVFYICYLAKMISQKRQGIKTDQLGKGKKGFVKFIEVTLKIMTYLLPIMQMKDNWRAGVQREEKTNLVTSGIYSISRNPAFLGFDLMYVGILFSFFNWYLCFATIFTVVFFHLQIVNVEEDFLIEAFGQEYIEYKKKVFRYLGRKKF